MESSTTNDSFPSNKENGPKKLDKEYYIYPHKKLGKGGFGQINLGENILTKEKVAIKIEFLVTRSHLYSEFEIMKDLQGYDGIPKIYKYIKAKENNFLIMELLGKSLEKIFSYYQRKFSIKTVIQIAYQMIEKIEFGIGVENVGKQKKKGKKPKEPKDSRKAAKKTGLVLDFQMIQKINECGLNPPTKMEDIPLFLKNLEKRQQGIQSGEISIEPPKKEEEPPKVEEKIVLKEVEEVKVVKEEKKVEPVQPKKKKEERKDIKKEEKKEEPKKEEKKEEKAVLPAQKVKSVEVKKEDEEEEDEEEEEEEDDEEEPKNANHGKPSNPAATQKTEIKKEEAGDKKAKKK